MFVHNLHFQILSIKLIYILALIRDSVMAQVIKLPGMMYWRGLGLLHSDSEFHICDSSVQVALYSIWTASVGMGKGTGG